ncbi:MAG TPA: maleylpyruvate isomerase N-terminal domain-containing protein, partial [Jatrophihabitans sp.]|nr:maleylpyruvate isomerase N-terminal domain-containing protein [Jatrophihabitans sp.]
MHDSVAAARRSALDRRTAMRLAATEYVRWADALDAVTMEQLSLPTDNGAWDVRAMVGHVVGMTEMAASTVETIRQQRAASRAASRSGAAFIDELTDLQVRKHASDSLTKLQQRMRRIGPKAVRGRRRTPPVIRNRTLPPEQALPELGGRETWTVGYLVDTILTRDPWMHRVDLSRATGAPMQLTAEHDGVLVADVVAEWAGRHAQPCSLTLTGP